MRGRKPLRRCLLARRPGHRGLLRSPAVRYMHRRPGQHQQLPDPDPSVATVITAGQCGVHRISGRNVSLLISFRGECACRRTADVSVARYTQSDKQDSLRKRAVAASRCAPCPLPWGGNTRFRRSAFRQLVVRVRQSAQNLLAGQLLTAVAFRRPYRRSVGWGPRP